MYLTYYRAYSPNTGRWISRDPIFEAGGVNLYAYVGNSPIDRTDPLGLFFTPDTLVDVGFIIHDLYRLFRDGECERDANLATLSLDLLGAALPGVTGLGTVAKEAKEASKVFSKEKQALVEMAKEALIN